MGIEHFSYEEYIAENCATHTEEGNHSQEHFEKVTDGEMVMPVRSKSNNKLFCCV